MNMTDRDLEAIPAQKEHKGFIVNLVLDFLINVGEEFFQKLLEHVRQKGAEKANVISQGEASSAHSRL